MINGKEKQSTWRKTCPSTLPNTISTWTAVELNVGLCSGKVVTNFLSYGMAIGNRQTNCGYYLILQNFMKNC
jgi:hypothetical protein